MKRFAIVAALLALVLAACVPAAGTVNPQQLNGSWSLLNIQYPDGEVATPDFGEYSIEFDFEEDRMFVVADCNQGSASFEANEDGSIVLGPLTQTMMACPPGSMGNEYALQLGMASSYGFVDGFLHMRTLDGVALVFSR